ncbi:MAG: cobalamin transport system ATP-binding protein [Thermacetogenium sp.]|jgi:iron complex transport system ATP-binding protein|nr:cobalamin transport system ATP-binding protein [Thermacetogenium sp.]
MDMIFRIHGVEFRYGARQALRGISLDVPPGSFLGIIGPNAAGKSTLLKTIAATLRPTRGVVYYRGERLDKISRRDYARDVSVVPQETEAHFPFSVLEVVLMGRHPYLGRFSGESEEDLRIARRAMEAANCWHLRDRSILELSGGERQRVVLARALAQNPQVILLDEPVAHLDLNAQLEVLNLLKEMNDKLGVTVIGVFHDLNLAAQYSDRLIVLREGKVYAAGTPDEVLTPEIIKEVYSADVLVIRHPLTGAPQVVLLPAAGDNPEADYPHVHLICGGGIGSNLMGRLTRMGCRVSAGVLNIKDTDWEVGRALGLQIVEEKPFSPITLESYESNLKVAEGADLIFLLEIPFGRGNILNLKVLEPLLASGKRCFLINPGQLPERDYTGGTAMQIVEVLREQGLLFLPDQQAVLRIVQNYRKGDHGAETALG